MSLKFLNSKKEEMGAIVQPMLGEVYRCPYSFWNSTLDRRVIMRCIDFIKFGSPTLKSKEVRRYASPIKKSMVWLCSVCESSCEKVKNQDFFS